MKVKVKVAEVPIRELVQHSNEELKYIIGRVYDSVGKIFSNDKIVFMLEDIYTVGDLPTNTIQVVAKIEIIEYNNGNPLVVQPMIEELNDLILREAGIK